MGLRTEFEKLVKSSSRIYNSSSLELPQQSELRDILNSAKERNLYVRSSVKFQTFFFLRNIVLGGVSYDLRILSSLKNKWKCNGQKIKLTVRHSSNSVARYHAQMTCLTNDLKRQGKYDRTHTYSFCFENIIRVVVQILFFCSCIKWGSVWSLTTA